MPISISFPGFDSHLEGNVVLPSSKSISNRVLIIKALCAEDFDLDHLSQSSDTQVLLKILNQFKETGTPQIFDVGDAGTSFRFLTAFFASKVGVDIILKGTERMHQRPIMQLVDALNTIGAEITYIDQIGYPPLRIKGKRMSGGLIKISGDISSQYISALCLIAPTLASGLEIEIVGKLVSAPYIEMTLDLMASFGIEIEHREATIELKPQPYLACDYYVEADWSSACFFYAMAMISSTARIHCAGLQGTSVQGDSYIRNLARDFEIETLELGGDLIISKTKKEEIANGRTYDLSAYPDLAMPVIVACGMRYPHVKFCGLQHLIYKESNRIQALQVELAKVGIRLMYENGLLFFADADEITKPGEIYFESYNDHRIAMSLSMFALDGHIVTLNNTACVQKSFPDFFQQLRNLGFSIHER